MGLHAPRDISVILKVRLAMALWPMSNMATLFHLVVVAAVTQILCSWCQLQYARLTPLGSVLNGKVFNNQFSAHQLSKEWEFGFNFCPSSIKQTNICVY